MGSDFRTVLLEGLFYEQDGKLRTDRGDSVEDSLTPFMGEDINIAIHHLPSFPIEPDKWGGGCCMWQPAECPAGHHEHPDRLLNVTLRGHLERGGVGKWYVDKLDGSRVYLPLALLDGHQARIACATVFSVEAMQEALGTAVTPEHIEALGIQAQNLKDLMAKLQEQLKKGEVQ